MSATIYVHMDHALNRYKVLPGLMLFNKVIVTSMEMAMNTVMLFQLHRPGLAHDLVNNDALKKNPTSIASWVKQHGVQPTTEWLFNQSQVYADLLRHFVDQSGPFREAVYEAYLSRPDPENLRFFVCSAVHELIWSAGISYGKTQQEENFHRPVLGFNMYGQLLENLLRNLKDNDFRAYWPGDMLLRIPGLFDESPQRRSVLVLGDSTVKFFPSIVNGKVISISGGRYYQILDAIEACSLNLSDYDYVIFVVGVNMLKASSFERERSWQKLRHVMVREARLRRDKSILLSPAIPHRKVATVRALTDEVKHSLLGENIAMVDWEVLGNPFTHLDDRIKSKYFEDDRFHPNHRGVRLMWRFWCDYLPNLHLIPYELSKDSCAYSKYHFADILRRRRAAKRNYCW
jgi:hypothetical protein